MDLFEYILLHCFRGLTRQLTESNRELEVPIQTERNATSLSINSVLYVYADTIKTPDSMKALLGLRRPLILGSRDGRCFPA